MPHKRSKTPSEPRKQILAINLRPAHKTQNKGTFAAGRRSPRESEGKAGVFTFPVLRPRPCLATQKRKATCWRRRAARPCRFFLAVAFYGRAAPGESEKRSQTPALRPAYQKLKIHLYLYELHLTLTDYLTNNRTITL